MERLSIHEEGCAGVVWVGARWEVGVKGIGCTTVSVNSGTIHLLVGDVSERTIRRGGVGGIVVLHMPLQLKFSIFSVNRLSRGGTSGLEHLVGTFHRLVGVCSISSCETYTASTVQSTHGKEAVVGGVRGSANVHVRVVSNRRRTQVVCGGRVRYVRSHLNGCVCISINNNDARVGLLAGNRLM